MADALTPKNKLVMNLSGGMNSHTSPLIIKDEECEFILNYNLDTIGALTRRNGYITFATQPVANKTISGLFGGLSVNNRGTFQYMTVNKSDDSNRVTYYNVAGTWTTTDDTMQTAFLPTTGSASQIYMTRFVSFLNYIFRLNGGNAPVSFLATTPQTATSVNLTDTDTGSALSITPSLGAVFQDRVYFNRVADGFRSRIYFSTVGTSGSTITWDTDATTGQWFDVNPDDGDFITALENNGNRLLIFKNYSMYRWTFGQVEPDRLIGVGTTSQESVKTNFDLGITFFANPKGIYAYTDGRPKLISRRIQEYIDAVSDWKYVAGGIDKEHYYLSVGDITVAGRTITNAVFVYNIPLDGWTIFSLAVKPTVWAEMPSTYPTQKLYFGSTDGRTYEFNSGTADSSGGAAVTISAEIRSKEYLLSYPQRTNFTWLDVFADQRVEANIFYDTDRYGEFIELGSLEQRITNFRVPQRECNTVRVKIADNSKDVSIINGWNIEHVPKEKRDETTANIRRQGFKS